MRIVLLFIAMSYTFGLNLKYQKIALVITSFLLISTTQSPSQSEMGKFLEQVGCKPNLPTPKTKTSVYSILNSTMASAEWPHCYATTAGRISFAMTIIASFVSAMVKHSNR